MPIGTSETIVSGVLNLDAGNYVLSAKLHVVHPGGLLVPAFNVTCMLDGDGLDEDETDSATVTLQPGELQALSLASTAEVGGSATVFVTCIGGQDNATALSIKLIAIRVDGVQLVQ